MRFLTPPEVADDLRVGGDKVLEWVHNGELGAINVARKGTSRPRWRIPQDAYEAFKRSRQAVPPAPPTKRVRRKTTGDVVKFF